MKRPPAGPLTRAIDTSMLSNEDLDDIIAVRERTFERTYGAFSPEGKAKHLMTVLQELLDVNEDYLSPTFKEALKEEIGHVRDAYWAARRLL